MNFAGDAVSDQQKVKIEDFVRSLGKEKIMSDKKEVARKKARDLIKRFGIKSLPVNVERIARSLEVKVEFSSIRRRALRHGTDQGWCFCDRNQFPAPSQPAAVHDSP